MILLAFILLKPPPFPIKVEPEILRELEICVLLINVVGVSNVEPSNI